MLTHDKLVELYRELQEEHVLSVYLDGEEHDPAERSKWRKQLDSMVAECRKKVEDGPQEDRERFEEALSRLQEELQGFDAFIPGRGWVGFATPDQVWYAEQLPVPMPDQAAWEPGIRVAPYVRALKQDRPVVVVLVDSQRARVFEYRSGEIQELDDLRADTFLGDLTDVGMRKRSAHRSGMRGETATDQAQRILEVSSERMLKELVDLLVERMDERGFLVVGGTPERVRHAASAVPKHMRDRVAERPSMHLDMTLPEVKEVAEHAASQMSKQHQERLLDEVIEMARSGGRACLGPEETERALREMRVHTLLISRNFREANPDFADRCVGTAFAQDAAVEELSALGADRLDREGDGIGARLRFLIRQNDEDEGESAA